MLALALSGAEWVLWMLIAVSVLCIAVSLERLIFLLREATSAATLRAAVDPFLQDGDVATLRTRLSSATGIEARVLATGLELAGQGPKAVEKAFAGAALAEKLRMERGLIVLATTGSNAPFIGLFGTVLGIIQAFHDLSIDTAGASEAVMSGISEALVATAVGLLVAIPAVVLYNGFARTVRNRLTRLESITTLVAARLEGL